MAIMKVFICKKRRTNTSFLLYREATSTFVIENINSQSVIETGFWVCAKFFTQQNTTSWDLAKSRYHF